MRALKVLFFPTIFLVFCGCATEQQGKGSAVSPSRVEMPQYIIHRVMVGETLATIAKWYSGKESNWKELSEYNPNLSPWKLRRGDVVKIPLYMTTVHKDQSDYSTAPRKVKKKRSTQSGGGGSEEVSAPDTPDTPDTPDIQEVFGPK